MPKHLSQLRLIILASSLLLGGLLIVLLLPQTALGKPTLSQAGTTQKAETQCSPASLKGTYLFAFNETLISDHDQTQAALAGWVAFDGTGHLYGLFSQSVNGQITRLIHFTGTNTIAANCTVTETDTTDSGAILHFDEFTTPDGSQFSFVGTDPQTVSTGIATRETTRLIGG